MWPETMREREPKYVDIVDLQQAGQGYENGHEAGNEGVVHPELSIIH